MNKLKTVIIDDEKKAREGLLKMLQKDPLVDIVSVSLNGIQAIEFINKNKVDLAFLDIQMPGIDGFDVLNSIHPSQMPFVIFVTAYDQYALKAFEYHALDYILKPFTDERFYEALAHAKKSILDKNIHENKSKLEKLLLEFQSKISHSENLHDLVRTAENIDKRIIIKTSGKKIILVNLEDIEWIEAFDYYIKIHTINETYVIRESLKNMELRLPSSIFLRIHKSTIVNTKYIKQIVTHKNSEYNLTLTNGDILKVSRSYSDKIKTFILNIE